jgi:hypothetical protein
MAVPYLACMVLTASFYHLPPRVLPSIQHVEGGQVGTVHEDTDGTQDLGVMQVNTRWIGPLARVARMTQDATRERLINDSCFNIAAGGLILRTYLNEEHGNLMRAVGDYHSHTPTRNLIYRVQVIEAAIRMFVQRTGTSAPTPIR